MLRIQTDLGLNYYIVKQIWDPKSKHDTIRRILGLIGEYSEDKHEIESKLKKSCLIKLVQSNIRLTYEDLSDEEDLHNKIVELFYHRLYSQAREKTDDVRVHAVKNAYFEYLSGEDLSYDLLVPEAVYEGSKYKNKYETRVKEFNQSHIKYSEIYDIIFDKLYLTRERFDQNLRLLKRVIFLEINHFMFDLISRAYDKESPDFEWYGPFMDQIIDVICFEYFQRESFEEKIKLLNQSYDLKGFEHLIVKFLEEEIRGDLTGISKMITALMDQGLEDLVIQIIVSLDQNESMNDNPDFPLFKFDILVDLGKYEDAKELAELIDINKQITYQELSMLLEYSIIKQDYENINHYLDLVFQVIEDSETDVYIRIMSEIGSTFKRHEEFEYELKILQNLYQRLQTNKIKAPEEIEDRLYYIFDAMKNFKEIDPYVDSPQQLLKFKQISENTIGKIFQALSLMNNFAFQQALKKYQEIYQVLEINKIKGLHDSKLETMSYIGMIQLFLTHDDEAFKTYTEIFETENRDTSNLSRSIIRDNTIFLLLHLKLNKKILKSLGNYFGDLDLENKIEVIELFVRYIDEFDSSENLQSYLSIFEPVINLEKYNFYKELGVKLRNKGLSLLARSILDNLLENKDDNDLIDDNLHADILRIIGQTYADYDLHEKAIEYYNLSKTKDDSIYLTYLALSEANENLLNYIQAIEYIEKAIFLTQSMDNLESERDKWIGKKQLLEELANNVFNINKIPTQRTTIRNMFRTGDFYFRELGKQIKSRSLDASPTFASYFKAFERMLHIEILQPFHHHMRINFSVRLLELDSSNNRRNELLKTFTNGRSLSPGQWRYILQNSNDELHNLLIDFMNNTYDRDLSSTIDEICNVVLTSEQELRFDQLRNKISHNEIIEYRTVEENRYKFVQSINKLIDKIYQ